jgi:hypothetical protein
MVSSFRELAVWDFINGADPEGRVTIRKTLEQKPGGQLVFVHYSPGHGFHSWIGNGADIDRQHIVWALDLGPEQNQKLMGYYTRRKSWLLLPDYQPPRLIPYPMEQGIFQDVR